MKYTKEQCISLLLEKSNTLNAIPKKKDFASDEVMAIKALLGPWPRALETAGIKPMSDVSRINKNREKHIRAKRKLTELKKENKHRKEQNYED